MTAPSAQQEIWRRSWRRRHEAKLKVARRGRATCPKRLGRGTCGGRLEDRVLPGGRVVTLCHHCERKERGLCRHCPAPVAGRAVLCADCRKVALRRYNTHYRRLHRDRHLKAAREQAARYRITHREEIRARLRRRGKYFTTVPTCRQCGDAIPYAGMGRPRLDCTSCRPGRVH